MEVNAGFTAENKAENQEFTNVAYFPRKFLICSLNHSAFELYPEALSFASKAL
jgi:hypothetical protein